MRRILCGFPLPIILQKSGRGQWHRGQDGLYLSSLPRRGELRDLARRMSLNLLTSAIVVPISGCVGPPVLERQVLGDDEVTKTLDEKLLLLNIARVSSQEPVHFTSTSSIAATFNWTATLGASGEVTESKGTNFLNLNIGGSASENPTFSISPISGKEFTERVATPF
jgi:hypothetical protein